MLKTEKKILALLSFFHAVLLGSVFYPVLAAVFQMKTAEAYSYLVSSLWLFAAVAVSYWGIRRIKGFFGYLLIAVCTCCGILGLSRCILTTILAALIFLIRCYVRIRRGQIRKLMQEMPGETGAQMDKELWEIPTLLDIPKMWHWGVFVLAYLLLVFLKREDLLRMVFWMLLTEIIICFLFTYIDRMVSFIAAKQHIANLPGRSVRRISYLVFGIGVLFLMVFLLPAVLYNEEPLTKIRLKPREIVVKTEQETQQQVSGGMEEMLANLVGEVKEPPRWMSLLSEFIRYAALTVLMLGIIFFLCKMGKQALQSFAGGAEEEDEIVFLGEESQEKLYGSDGKIRSGEKWNSPNKKIRRRYKKVITQRRKQRPAGWESPTELEAAADLSGIADGERFHRLYEKARYSREGCNREEAQEYRI